MDASTLTHLTSGNTQEQETCLLAQVSLNFYENQLHLGASFSFVSNQDLLGLALISSKNIYKDHSAKWENSHDDVS